MRYRGWFIAIACLWSLAWLWLGRFFLLDDCLISLRYAYNLVSDHTFTFNGDSFSVGFSCPLYVMVLAASSCLVHSPLLPKAFSLLGYLILVGLIIRGLLRSKPAVQPAWAALLIVCISPTATRWLADGMETSWTAVFAVLLGGVSRHFVGAQPPNLRQYALLATFGFLVALLRVEMSLMIFLVTLLIVANAFGAGQTASSPPQSKVLAVVRIGLVHSHLAIGGLLALVVVRALTGHLLSDAALAKQVGPQSLVTAVSAFLKTTFAAMTFGTGLLALWLASMIAAFSCARMVSTIANLAPCFIVLGVMRTGQTVMGVRYLVWAFVFSIVCNLEIISARREYFPFFSRLIRFPAARYALASILVAGLAIAWTFESRITYQIVEGGNQRFAAMTSDDLGRLRGYKGVAYDVGFIGLLSEATILDMAGLVNGLEISRMPIAQRGELFAKEKPEFLFVDGYQAREIGRWIDTREFLVWRSYNFRIVTWEDVHYLAIRSDIAKQLKLDTTSPLPSVAGGPPTFPANLALSPISSR